MERPRLLDLYCKQGGAGMGYHLAGFDVTGIDIEPQPRYPFNFIQCDAIEYLLAHGSHYDLIHASPPCQKFSQITPLRYRDNHPDLIGPTREALLSIGKPFVIENVRGARHLLRNPVMLCGSMFGLPIFRHRYFEVNPNILVITPPCKHDFVPVLVTGRTNRKGEKRMDYLLQVCKDATGIQWMSRRGMDEAVPPVYTKFLGERLCSSMPTPCRSH